MWWLYALLSAVFAALTAVLAEIGIKGVDSNLAIAIVLSVVFLGEKLTWHTGLGAAMIIGGTLVLIF